MSGRIWLGNPANTAGMVELPPNGQGVSSPWSDADTEHTLASGGTAVTHMPQVRRRYPITWPVLTPAQASIVLGFKVRSFGSGPFALIDPSWPNLLTLDASLSGARLGAKVPWLSSGATEAAAALADDVAAPVIGAAGACQVAGTTGGTLTIGKAGTDGPDADPASAIPYVADLAYTISVYTKADAAASIKLRALGVDGDGTGTVIASKEASVAFGTAWARVSLSIAADDLGAARYLVPQLKFTEDILGDTNLAYVSAPQVNAGGSAEDWCIGNGCPRVLPVGDAGHSADTTSTHSAALTLAEV